MNMQDKYQDKYRIASTRLQHWDYRWAGAYFITICTKIREHYFGEVIDDKMQLSGIGIIADIMWYEIKNHAANIELGAFVVMPNHIHGILILNGGDDGGGGKTVRIDGNDADHKKSATQPPPQPPIGSNRFQNIGKNSVSSIIGSYKSAVTKHSHRLGFDFEWQARFHDHIIRDEAEYDRITNYIVNNVANWKEDKFYE